MAIVAFWLALIFFVGCLAMVWWLLLVDHDLTEEPLEKDQDDGNPFAGVDGVSSSERRKLRLCTAAYFPPRFCLSAQERVAVTTRRLLFWLQA